ncbi:MAG: ABC transporter ATP-binding protein [Burkholderiaceae bacterium]
MQQQPLLELKGVSRYFGGVKAVHNVSLVVNKGELLALIGPNGAGKSTLFHSVSGMVQPGAGQVLWRGEDITALQPEQRVVQGIACTFQNLRLFPEMSVKENVVMGAYHRQALTWPGVIASLFQGFSRMRSSLEEINEILELVGLADIVDADVGSLSYGAKKRLELARALATKPELILLDEPVAGMNATEKKEIQEVLLRLKSRGLTIFVVEHDMQFVMSLADRVIVMNLGEQLAVGTPKEVQQNREVQVAYLGTE